MAPTTGTAILVLALFVLPGFVTLLFRERLFVVRSEEQTLDRLLHALLYSAVIYGIALAVGVVAGLDKKDLVEFYDGNKSLAEDLWAALLVALALPAAIALTSALWRRSKTLRPWLLERLGGSVAHGTSSAWNAFFSRDGSCMIRATLIDGRVVGGFYGKGSFAAYTEHGGDLYIVQRWVLDDDGWFVEPAEESLGLWISAAQLASFEVYSPADI